MRTLRQHRRSRFMTLQRLAYQAEVGQNAILNIELGRTTPQFRTIRKISRALGVDPAEITEFAVIGGLVPDEAQDPDDLEEPIPQSVIDAMLAVGASQILDQAGIPRR